MLSLALPFLVGCGPFSGTQSASQGNIPLQQPPSARITYVAIGASDTFGQGADDPQTQSWPADLALLLGKDVRLVNLGVPGIHVQDALKVELPIVSDTHPNLITVWLAVNDLADQVPLDQYTQALNQLLDRLQSEAPHAQIAVANVPDVTLLPRFQSYDQQSLQQKIAAYNSVIASSVARHHVVLVDLYQQWQEIAAHPEYVSSDGFHPSTLGYARVAQIFYQNIHKPVS